MSDGMFDAYLICQALGWEWNLTNMIIVSLAPMVIIGAIIFFIFVLLPYILEKM